MRIATWSIVALAVASFAGDRARDERPRGIPLAALSVPFLASVDDAGVAAFHAWTFAGPVVVTRDGAIATLIGAGGWQKASTREGAPIVTERFVGATPRPRAGARSATSVSMLRDARSQAPADMLAFDSVDLGEAWAGIGITLVARARSVEKVFTVAPGASPGAIRVELDGVDALRVDADGRLVATAAGGEIAYSAPVAWQDGWLGRTRIDVEYAPEGMGYGFVVGEFNRAKPLVIEPFLLGRSVAPSPRAS